MAGLYSRGYMRISARHAPRRHALLRAHDCRRLAIRNLPLIQPIGKFAAPGVAWGRHFVRDGRRCNGAKELISCDSLPLARMSLGRPRESIRALKR